MKKTFSILFVCMGNTCRSPLAEVMMKAEVRKKGIRHTVVSSAGTVAGFGGSASENAKAVARHLGLSLSGFRSRPLTQTRLRRADLILTMTEDQREEIANRWPEAAAKTFMISAFSGSKRKEIVDPMGASEEVYWECADALKDEIERIVPKVKRRLKARRGQK